MFTMRSVGFSVLSCVAAVASGCSGEYDPSTDTFDVSEEELAKGNSWQLWPQANGNYPVNVCFRACRLNDPDLEQNETQQQCDDGKANVEKWIREYARYSRVTLPATISECANSGDRNPGWVRLNFARVDRNAGGTNTLVRYVNNVKEENPGAGYPGTGWQLRTSLGSQNSGVVRHEFGHALGFAHEYTRSDEPTGTTCIDDGVDLTPQSGSVTNLTADYDHNSIMNYSYCNSARELSPGDIAGLQTAYGTPYAKSIVNQRFGRCFGPGTTSTQPLTDCTGGASSSVGYNLTSLLGTMAGLHRGNQTNVVLNVVTNDNTLQWNSNVNPSNTPSAQWKLKNARIVGLGGMCLTQNGLNGTAKVQACDPALASTQTWTFDSRSASHQYRIQSVGNTSLCLSNSNNVLKTVDCSANPTLTLDQGAGRFRSGNNCLVVDGGKPVVGSSVKLAACSTANDQQWMIHAQLENVATSQCLRVTGTQTVDLSTCEDTSTRAWELRP
jgi:hypothetical protein